MGWQDGVTAPGSLFRVSVDGQRVYAPVGKRGPLFLVSDAAAERIQRDVRVYFRYGLPLVVAAVVLTTGRSTVAWAVPPLLLVGFAFRFWLARGLPRAPFGAANLEPRSYRAQLLADARVTGLSTLRQLRMLAWVAVLVGVVDAMFLGDPAGGWLLCGMMTVASAILTWEVRLLRTSTSETRVRSA